MSGEKTEKATPQKLKESRKKGQISQSQDLTKLLIGVGLTEIIFAMAQSTMARLTDIVALPVVSIQQDFPAAIKSVAGAAAQVALPVLAITLMSVILLRIAGGWLQFGVLFAPEAAKPKFTALNPLNKFKEIFSVRQIVQLLQSVVKAAVLGCLFWMQIKPHLNEISQLATGSLEGFWQGSLTLLHILSRLLFGAMLLFSLLDFGIQRFFWLKQNRMSHDDIRNEYKQSEGDPHAKNHRKQVAMEIVNEPIKKRRPEEVAKADVVLVNPTHFAIGLFYDPQETPLPKVIFKAQEEDAQEIISLAKAQEVPVVRYIWLTRTLWRDVEEGGFVSRETLKAVAQIYRLLRELEEGQHENIIEYQER